MVSKVFFFSIALFLTLNKSLFSQELRAEVTVNVDQIKNPNRSIFKNLEIQLKEYINNQQWTELKFKEHERIDCSFFITVTKFDSNNFEANLQVQSSRPVFQSSYNTPMFNRLDEDFSFRYVEFEKFYFDPNSFDSNLTSVIGYYAFIIIGLDQDSFELQSGTDLFEQALNVVDVSRSSGFKGWSSDTGNRKNRYFLVNDLLSASNSSYREVIYQYHLNGLDKMSQDLKYGKQQVIDLIFELEKLFDNNPSTFLIKYFMDAKSDEIVKILKDGPYIDTSKVVETLNKIATAQSLKWNTIR